MSVRNLRRLVPALLLATGACESTPPAPVPTSIVLDRSEVLIDDGDTTRLSATVLDQRGEPMDSLPPAIRLVWSSSATGVARVEDGLVVAVAPGTAEVTVSAGEAEAKSAVTVRAVPVGIRPISETWHEGTVAVALPDSIGVRVYDRSGRPVPGVAVSFTVVEGGGQVASGTVTSNASGNARTVWLLGVATGRQAVEARAAGLQSRIEFVAHAKAGPAAEVRPYGGNGQAGSPGATLPLPLQVRVRDAHGNGVGSVAVGWSIAAGGGSVSPDTSTTDSMGIAAASWVLGPSGEQAVSASVQGLGPALFSSSLDGTATAPVITAISPALLQPAATAAISGDRFGSDAGAVRVTIADVEAHVLSVGPTSIEIRVPDRHLLPCGPVASANVIVTVHGSSGVFQHPLEVAQARPLARGEAVSLSSAAEMSCNALPAEGEYMISVASTATSIGALVPVHLRATGTTSVAPAYGTGPLRTPRRAGVVSPLAEAGDPVHAAVLESSRQVLSSHGPVRRSAGSALWSTAAAEIPDAGDTISFRVPNIQSSDLCSGYFTVRARVLHVGTRAIALEDVAAPLAGTMDSRIQAVAAEYESQMHPLLLEYFGNPLAIDSQTDGDGRLYMLFTKHVNDAGARGFVWGGNFTATESCAASNQAEVFYAAVPTVADGGFGADTPEQWSWTIRNVLVHEVKHLASYAERLAAAATVGTVRLEEVWLEESTARAAEEIWARSAYGYAQLGNTSHQASIYCEVRPTWAECQGKPQVMINHFAGLYEWHRGGGSRTPLGRVTSNDHTFYGSGWALSRWAADHSGDSEAHFFRTLTAGREPGGSSVLVGTENLSVRTGRDFAAIIEDWAVSMLVDDYPEMTAADPLHTFPTWNTRDVFAGINADFPDSWVHPHPAIVRDLPLDGSEQSFYDLQGGSAAYWKVAGNGSVIAAYGSTSLGLAPHVRITIIRVH